MSEEPVEYTGELEGSRDAKGRFLPGNPIGSRGGRPKGYSQRLSVIVHNLISDELELNGKNLINSILDTRDPKFVLEFFKLASSLVPKQVEVETSSQTDELLALLASHPNNSPMSKLKSETDDSATG